MATTEERLKQYEDLYAKAAAYDPTQFQTDFQKAYGEATQYNKDLINQQSTALGQLQTIAPTYRERYMNSLITDPTRQMSLIAQARQAPLTDYSNAVNLLSARGNKYSDILSKALGAYTQESTNAQNAAENAWRLYQDAVSQDQFNRNLRASSASSSSALGNVLASILGQGSTTTAPATNTSKQQVLNAINSIKQMRNISDPVESMKFEAKMNQYHSYIMDLARRNGINLNPEALWQQLGNTPANTRMTYNLFM